MSRSQKSDALIIETLRKKGYKATTQRIAICRFALHSRDHPSAQRVYDEVRRVHPTVSLATVYKTLQILTEHGLVQELDLPESQARFDSYVEPHINLVCIRCGNIQDFDDSAAREMVERVAAKAEFTRKGNAWIFMAFARLAAAETSSTKLEFKEVRCALLKGNVV